MKKKVIIFGTGSHYLHHKYLLDENWEVIAFADNDINKIGRRFEGKDIIDPKNLIYDVMYDYIIVATMVKDQVIKQLLSIGISNQTIKILNCYGLVDPNFLNVEVLDDGRSLFHIENISFYCDTRSDYNVVQELYDDGSYYFKQKNNKYTVIDIGMNTGIAALYFAKNDWVTAVYGYEPFNETYMQAIENFAINKLSIRNKIISHNFGLDDRASIKQINYNASFSGGMSTEYEAEILNENTTQVKLEKAEIIIKNIISNHSDNKILLKIDCEGSEYNIITNLYYAKLLSYVNVILLEWHDSSRNNQLEEQILDSGFSLIKNVGNGGRGFIYATKNE